MTGEVTGLRLCAASAGLVGMRESVIRVEVAWAGWDRGLL